MGRAQRQKQPSPLFSPPPRFGSISLPSPALAPRRMARSQSTCSKVALSTGETARLYACVSWLDYSDFARGGRPRDRRIARSVQLKAIKLGCVVPKNFSLIGFVDMIKIGGDFFARFGPEGRTVGKIRRPENIVHADVMAMGDAEAVIDKRRVELAAKIVARLHRQFGPKGSAAKADAGGAETLVDAK